MKVVAWFCMIYLKLAGYQNNSNNNSNINSNDNEYNDNNNNSNEDNNNNDDSNPPTPSHDSLGGMQSCNRLGIVLELF